MHIAQFLYVAATVLSVAFGAVVYYYSHTLRPYMVDDPQSKHLYSLLVGDPLWAFASGAVIGIPYFLIFRNTVRRWSRLIRNEDGGVVKGMEYVKVAAVVFIFPLTSATIAVIFNISILNSVFGCSFFFFWGALDKT
jgi:hypothetical protein